MACVHQNELLPSCIESRPGPPPARNEAYHGHLCTPPLLYTTIHAQVRRGPSGWTLGGRAGVSQPLGSAMQARDGTPLVFYMAPTQGQRDASATALPPRRTSGSGMPPPGPPTRAPHFAAVPANCIPMGQLSSPPRAHEPRTPCASGWRPAATGAGESVVWPRISASLSMTAWIGRSTPSRRYPRKLRRRACIATTWHASPAPTIVLNLH